MIARILSVKPKAEIASDPGNSPAWEVFARSQCMRDAPQALVLQTEHARLAGRLARELTPDTFGDLPSEVLDAVDFHDEGWEQSDLEQLDHLQQKEPKPFLAFAPGEEFPSWERSLEFADSKAPLTRLMISRHFCALAKSLSPKRTAFLEFETNTRLTLERTLNIAAKDLKRWTDALGFCDLLSLYLCCGSQEPAQWALAHPAEPYAAQSQHVTSMWEDASLTFSRPIFADETKIAGRVLRFDAAARAVSPVTIQWSIRRAT